MKNNDETLKLITKTIQEGLTKFVGEANVSATREVMKSHMITVLKSLINVADIRAPLPEIRVDVHGNQATVRFFDPFHTDEELSLGMWLSRASEGYYD